MSVRIDAVPAPTGRDWTTGLALTALVAAFGVVAGPLGLLAGIATAIVGYVLGPPYALALGHVALVAAVPEGIDLRSILVVEAAFVAVLLAPVRRTVNPARVALAAVACTLALAGTAWLVVDSQSILPAAVALLTLFAITAYGLHRLELVRLGLVPDGDGDAPSSTSGESTDGQTTGPSPETTAESPVDASTDTPRDT